MENLCAEVRMPCGDDCPRAGYAFVPIQQVTRYYDYESGLMAGSIFPELVIPKGEYGPKENKRR